jgi:hypothetical protein
MESFDWKTYINNYEDLRNANINTKEKAWKHWINHGKAEGRVYTNIYNNQNIKITIATMVKNEDDIIREWIEYHGNIFGYKNLYIIDNFSTDNTYELCKEYISLGIHLSQELDYNKKGDFMTRYKNNTNCDIFIPLDIDEFICYHNKENNTVSNNKNIIINYLTNLTNNNNGFYKMNYISPINTNNENGLNKFTHGQITDYLKNMAKTFVITKYIPKKFIFDHGNHVHFEKFILSNLLLIHYHERSHDQVLKKIIANVTGLGYPYELNKLKTMKIGNGSHRVNQAIQILENPDTNLSPPLCVNISNDFIDIKDIIKPFNSTFYLDNYPELRNAGILTHQQALIHWINWGEKEGRVFLK